MNQIKVALVGVGNCASSLVQGRYYYDGKPTADGLMHERIGGYRLSDIEFVLAIDTDARKVGKDLGEAIFAAPNCTTVFQHDVPATGVAVRMGRVLDGMAAHMEDAGERGFVRADAPEAVRGRDRRGAEGDGRRGAGQLPSGRLGGGDPLLHGMRARRPGWRWSIACRCSSPATPQWERRFREKRLPIVGDDIKAQLGATIVHRVLSSLFRQRGVSLSRTYQLNTGGNTDFMNMLDRGRLASKKESKTEAVQSTLADRLDANDIHIGPSDYIPWLDDNKLCFLRIEGALFGDVPMNLEMRLSVEDSPNSAAVVVDAIRCCKVALDRGVGGVLIGPSASFCKHPPQQFSDDVAAQLTEEFIAGDALAAE